MDFDLSQGLTTIKAKELQNKFGLNDIEEKLEPPLVRLLKKFIGPIPLMIELAFVLSAIARKWEDLFIIGVLLAVNIGVDFFQEQKAHNALQALKNTLSPIASVVRDGALNTIDAKELVPGDIIRLGIGDSVPADSIILDDTSVEVDQSVVTGESLAVSKGKDDSICTGSIIQKGATYARVSATGRNSSVGTNANLVARAQREEKSHFQKAIIKISRFLIIVSSVLIVFIFWIMLSRGETFLEVINFSLVVAVASIPVALPAVLSVTLAIGASLLAKKKAIVSNFKAIEELAGVDQLCIDKTGTLTKNELSVYKAQSYGSFDDKDLFVFANLSGDPSRTTPIDRAIYEYSKENNILELLNNYKIKSFIPFNPEAKITQAKFSIDKKNGEVIMGASQAIAKYLNDAEEKKIIEKDTLAFANDGLKSIVVAKKKGNKFELVGLIALLDPPREDSKKTIEFIKEQGVNIKMLTGDNSAIANFISKMLNISPKNTFSEVVPEDKFNIVDSLQKKDHIVAMTGDGVNDAPALKKADIGIAVSGATPAARSAADIVLLDDDLSVFKDMINNARMIFMRMQSYATFRISETIRIIFFITFCVIVFGYSPLTAIMVILIALLNDIPVMSIAYDNAIVPKKPIRWHLRETIIVASVLGITGLTASLSLFCWLNISGFSIAFIQTVMFLKFDVAGHSILYTTRTGRKHFWQKPYPSLKFFLPAFSSRILGTIIALFGILMQAISWQTVIFIWLYSTIWFLISDWIKVYTYKIIDAFKVRSKKSVVRNIYS